MGPPIPQSTGSFQTSVLLSVSVPPGGTVPFISGSRKRTRPSSTQLLTSRTSAGAAVRFTSSFSVSIVLLRNRVLTAASRRCTPAAARFEQEVAGDAEPLLELRRFRQLEFGDRVRKIEFEPVRAGLHAFERNPHDADVSLPAAAVFAVQADFEQAVDRFTDELPAALPGVGSEIDVKPGPEFLPGQGFVEGEAFPAPAGDYLAVGVPADWRFRPDSTRSGNSG